MLHEDQYTFFIISQSILFRMRNVSDKGCREYQSRLFMLSNFFLTTMLFYEITWKNIVEPNMPQMTIWRMHIACRIPKATNTQSQSM
jgi:glycine cleavage system regulatory protein